MLGGGIHRVAGACGALPSAPCPQVYVLKRPHVDEFLQRMGELFECVLFTASLAKVGAPPPPPPPSPSPSRPPLGWHNSPWLPTCGHRWPLVPCVPAGSACPSQAPARETEAQSELALVQSWVPSSLGGGRDDTHTTRHGGTM